MSLKSETCNLRVSIMLPAIPIALGQYCFFLLIGLLLNGGISICSVAR
jgi:hypothetical protein